MRGVWVWCVVVSGLLGSGVWVLYVISMWCVGFVGVVCGCGEYNTLWIAAELLWWCLVLLAIVQGVVFTICCVCRSLQVCVWRISQSVIGSATIYCTKYIALDDVVLYNTIQYYTYCTVFCCIALCCTVLYCSI